MFWPLVLPLSALSVLLVSTVSSVAADIAASSRIDAATVFPLGAEVTRLAKVRIAAGEHAVVLKDLPQSVIAASIRVDAKATGALSIGAVDTQRTFVSEAETAISAAERRQIEAEIEKLNDEKAQRGADIEAGQAQKKLIASLAESPTRPVPLGAAAPQTDYNALAQLVATQTAAAQRLILEAQVKIRDIDKKIVELQKKLAPIAPAQVERTEVRIAVTAPQPVEADFVVRYQVPNAAWTPFYDARLTTGSRTAAPRLQLVRRASIQQRTGEAWDNIALTLSTTRPSQGSQAPDLSPLLVDLFDPAQVHAQAQVRRERAVMEDARVAGNVAPPPASAPAKVAAAPAPIVQAQVVQATIDGNAFQALFGIPGRHSVPTGNEVKRVQIDQADVDNVPLTVRTVPKRDPRAFLYAKLKMPGTTAILPGQVSLFRDGTFVGNGRFPQLTPGEEHELGFGQDDNVRVKYAVVDEKRGESGIISTSKTEAKSFKITVKSAHERSVQVRVIDQVPVAQNQEIKVEPTFRVQPSARDMDDKRGLVAWDFELKPDEERVLDFGYRMTWPGAKQLTGR